MASHGNNNGPHTCNALRTQAAASKVFETLRMLPYVTFSVHKFLWGREGLVVLCDLLTDDLSLDSWLPLAETAINKISQFAIFSHEQLVMTRSDHLYHLHVWESQEQWSSISAQKELKNNRRTILIKSFSQDTSKNTNSWDKLLLLKFISTHEICFDMPSLLKAGSQIFTTLKHRSQLTTVFCVFPETETEWSQLFAYRPQLQAVRSQIKMLQLRSPFSAEYH